MKNPPFNLELILLLEIYFFAILHSKIHAKILISCLYDKT